MNYFSIPADFKFKTIDEYEKINNHYQDSRVNETYGQITVGSEFEAGRIREDIPQVDFKLLKEYVEYSKAKNIGFNYTMNGPCMNNKEFTKSGIIKIKKFIEDLFNIGIRSFTFALPSLMDIAQSLNLDIEIKASTICSINNANKALTFKNMGINKIVVEESINRDFFNLRRIVNTFGNKVEVIINTLCYKDCTYRQFHYNQMGHDSIHNKEKSISTYYNHLCMLKRCEKLSNILKLSWIRPEDIKHYSNIGINYFKVQGRHTVLKGNPVRLIESYFNESYDGNLIELLELFNPFSSFTIYVDNKKLEGYLEKFIENEHFCKRDCNNCGYCDMFIKKATDTDQSNATNQLATKFYQEYDEFSNLIVSTNKEEIDKLDKLLTIKKQQNNSKKEISFNF